VRSTTLQRDETGHKRKAGLALALVRRPRRSARSLQFEAITYDKAISRSLCTGSANLLQSDTSETLLVRQVRGVSRY